MIQGKSPCSFLSFFFLYVFWKLVIPNTTCGKDSAFSVELSLHCFQMEVCSPFYICFLWISYAPISPLPSHWQFLHFSPYHWYEPTWLQSTEGNQEYLIRGRAWYSPHVRQSQEESAWKIDAQPRTNRFLWAYRLLFRNSLDFSYFL